MDNDIPDDFIPGDEHTELEANDVTLNEESEDKENQYGKQVG